MARKPDGQRDGFDEVADRVERRYMRQLDKAISEQKRREAIEVEPTLRRDAQGVEIARYSDEKGTPELRSRGTKRERHNIEGEIRTVNRTVDLMDQMLSRNSITPQQAMAGRRFRSLFELAGLQALRAKDVSRPPGMGAAAELPLRVIASRQIIGEAVEALGGHGTLPAKAAWHVLGGGLTIKEFSQRATLPGQTGDGRKLGEEQARGILIAALSILDAFFARHRAQSAVRSR